MSNSLICIVTPNSKTRGALCHPLNSTFRKCFGISILFWVTGKLVAELIFQTFGIWNTLSLSSSIWLVYRPPIRLTRLKKKLTRPNWKCSPKRTPHDDQTAGRQRGRCQCVQQIRRNSSDVGCHVRLLCIVDVLEVVELLISKGAVNSGFFYTNRNNSRWK